MPIDYKEYHPDWKAISLRIRNDRACNKCEWCGEMNGEWYEKGKMGWWGVVQDEKDPNQWYEEFHKLFDALPDDTLVSIVDCHI